MASPNVLKWVARSVGEEEMMRGRQTAHVRSLCTHTRAEQKSINTEAHVQ